MIVIRIDDATAMTPNPTALGAALSNGDIVGKSVTPKFSYSPGGHCTPPFFNVEVKSNVQYCPETYNDFYI